MKNGAKPINPILDWNEVKADSIGLTKREYFAGLAMQGLLSNPNNSNSVNEITLKAVIYSDKLLKQLEL